MTKKKVAKKLNQPEEIKIPRPDYRKARITLEGISPLLVNNFDAKTRKQIEDSYQKKAKAKAVPLTPKQQYESSLYNMKKGQTGMPAAGIKLAAVSACRFVEGMKMTEAIGSFHVTGDTNGLIPIKGKHSIDERLVRVGNFGNKKPATRYRARYDKWEVTFDVMYNAGVISTEQILNLYETAGFSVGLCEYRPEKKGNLGMFQVKRK